MKNRFFRIPVYIFSFLVSAYLSLWIADKIRNFNKKTDILTSVSRIWFEKPVLSSADLESERKLELANKRILDANINISKSLEELELRSDIIAIIEPTTNLLDNKILSIGCENENESYYKYTLSNVRVLSTIKGEQKASFYVYQQAPRIDSSGNISIERLHEHETFLLKNRIYLLYLERSGTSEEAYSVLSVYQGKFNLDGYDKFEKLDAETQKIKDKALKKQENEIAETVGKINGERSPEENSRISSLEAHIEDSISKNSYFQSSSEMNTS